MREFHWKIQTKGITISLVFPKCKIHFCLGGNPIRLLSLVAIVNMVKTPAKKRMGNLQGMRIHIPFRFISPFPLYKLQLYFVSLPLPCTLYQ